MARGGGARSIPADGSAGWWGAGRGGRTGRGGSILEVGVGRGSPKGVFHDGAVGQQGNGDGRPEERWGAPVRWLASTTATAGRRRGGELGDVEEAPDGDRRRPTSGRPSAADSAEGNQRREVEPEVIDGGRQVVEACGTREVLEEVATRANGGRWRLSTAGCSAAEERARRLGFEGAPWHRRLGDG
jgi:hypothetical protein